jgi:hypothetical protein
MMLRTLKEGQSSLGTVHSNTSHPTSRQRVHQIAKSQINSIISQLVQMVLKYRTIIKLQQYDSEEM